MDASAAAERVHESEYVARQSGLSVNADVDGARHAHGDVYAPVDREYANVRGAPLNAAKHRLPSGRRLSRAVKRRARQARLPPLHCR